MKKAIKIVGITLLSLVVVFIVCAVVVSNIIFTPEKITPIVNDQINSLIIGKSEIKSVKIDFFSAFPELSIIVDSLALKDSCQVDILSFDKLSVEFQPLPYLSKKAVVINRIELESPIINLLTDENGVSNIDLFIEQNQIDTAVVDSAKVRLSDYASSYDINNIVVTNCDFTSIDNQINSEYVALGVDLALSGKLLHRISDLKLAFSSRDITMIEQGRTKLRDFSIDVNSDIIFNRDSLLMTIENSNVTLKNMGLTCAGTMQFEKEKKGAYCDLNFAFAVSSFENIIKRLPPTIVLPGYKFAATGSAKLDGKVVGFLDNESIPDVDAVFTIADGSFKFDAMKYGVEKFEVVANLIVYGNNLNASYVDIDKIEIVSDAGVDINVQGVASELLGDCNVEFIVDSKMDMSKISQILPLSEAIEMSGQNSIHIDGSMMVKDIMNSNYGTLKLDGKSDLIDFLLIVDGNKLPDSTQTNTYLFMQMDRGYFNFGSGDGGVIRSSLDTLGAKKSIASASSIGVSRNRDNGGVDSLRVGGDSLSVARVGIPDSLRRERSNLSQRLGERNLSTLTAELAFSGVGFRNKDGIEVMLSDVKIGAKSQIVADTSYVTPIVGDVELKRTSMSLADTLSSYIGSTNINFELLPVRGNRTKSTKRLKIQADSATAYSIPTMTDLTLKSAMVDLLIFPDSTKARGAAMTGEMDFEGLELFSKLFPLDITMPRSHITYRDGRTELVGSRINVGRSDFTATGWVENLLARMFGTNTDSLMLKGDLQVKSRNVDLLQLYNASLAADSISATQNRLLDDSLSHDNAGEIIEILKIPSYLDYNLKVDVQKMSFEKLVLEKVDGGMVIKDETLTLDSLNFFTAGSDMNISANYIPQSDTVAKSFFDFRAKGVELAELIEVIPSIDTLMPMLKDIDGNVDFEMVANSDFNRYMELDMPTLRSVMSVKGRELVLFDSETFSSVAKMLKFKNRDRNIIDSLNMNVIIKSGGVIDIPPFEFEMDRYRAIIGGTQTIDFNTFDIDYYYNVSVIKSPLFFKAGVDITGKNEDFDFKLTKAKLKKSDFDLIDLSVDSLKNELISRVK
ncbi:MAG: AsmA family protein [Rikenellaceae bacterium]